MTDMTCIHQVKIDNWCYACMTGLASFPSNDSLTLANPVPPCKPKKVFTKCMLKKKHLILLPFQEELCLFL